MVTLQRNKKPFFYFNKPCSLKSKASHFLLLLVKKCQFFVYLDLVKRRLEIMLTDFAEEKETFFSYKKHNFSKSKKSHFSEGVNSWFWSKNANFFLFLDSIKIRLEIILSEFAMKKETFFDLEKQNFSKSKKSHFFSKGLTHAFGQKMPIFFN